MDRQRKISCAARDRLMGRTHVEEDILDWVKKMRTVEDNR